MTLNSNGFQQLTSLAAATALTVPAKTHSALIQAESQAVRFRDDGTNPTAAIGMRLAAGDSMLYDGSIASLKFIEEAASAKLNVTYLR